MTATSDVVTLQADNKNLCEAGVVSAVASAAEPGRLCRGKPERPSDTVADYAELRGAGPGAADRHCAFQVRPRTWQKAIVFS